MNRQATMNRFSLEEQVVACAVASLGKKRVRDEFRIDPADAAGGCSAAKTPRVFGPSVATKNIVVPQPDKRIASKRTLRPAPFFYYQDFSTCEDPDPLTPPTPPGLVPNFLAKMHAILSRPDLSDIIAWMPHGRSWRVLKPREFETHVIPTYFEQSKFSSFIRQANGWGFRRITQGRDRNSYYHELFLRGMPHLCKQMKRPGVAEKAVANASHEPDFNRISEVHPVPEKADDESIMLKCTVQGGPKARMPVYGGSAITTDSSQLLASSVALNLPDLSSFARAPSALNSQIAMRLTQESNVRNLFASPNSPFVGVTPSMLSGGVYRPMESPFGMPMLHAAAASQFAAGFAAATALSSAHMRNVVGLAAAVSPDLHEFAPNKNVSPLTLLGVASKK
jgi:hypothetical protein